MVGIRRSGVQAYAKPLRLRRELEVPLQVRQLLDLAGQDGGFGDVLQAPAHGAVVGREYHAAATALGDVFAEHLAFTDELGREAGGAA
jgi:hypothetical protein